VRPLLDSPPTFIDLFSGCGGLTLGLFQAGWRGYFGIELRDDAFLTYKTNFLNGQRHSLDWPRWLDQKPWDIADLLSQKRSQIKTLRGTVDLVCGGPPCQGFSFSGRRDPLDPRNQLYLQYIDFVELVQPRVLLIENVLGFTIPHGQKARNARQGSRKGRPRQSGAQKLRRKLEESYVVDDCLVHAADYGVPQIRDRYFAIGIRRDLFDAQKAGWAQDLIAQARPILLARYDFGDTPNTSRQALHDLEIKDYERNVIKYVPDSTCRTKGSFVQIRYTPPKSQNAYLKAMRSGVNGDAPNSLRLPRHGEAVEKRFQRIIDHFPGGRRLNDEERRRLGLKKMRIVRLEPDAPAHTLTTLPDDLLHYCEPRILTAREYARIQSFPDYFEFHGKYTTGGDRRTRDCPRYTQIGNAVPPLVAEAWGLAIATLLKTL
jgi:DNA (cytosine-5)-methyltransferase 1